MFRTLTFAVAFAAATSVGAQTLTTTIEELKTVYPEYTVTEDGTFTRFEGTNANGDRVQALFDSQSGTLLDLVTDGDTSLEEDEEAEEEGRSDRRRGSEDHPGRHLGNDGIANHPVFGDQDRPGRNRGSDDDDREDDNDDDSGSSRDDDRGNGNGGGNGKGRSGG